MKTLCTLFFVVFFFTKGICQNVGSFKVNGDINTYYPVTFLDPAWQANPVFIQIYRFVHDDASWRGTLNSSFRYQANAWGAGANFIKANIDMFQNGYGGSTVPFIAGWTDASFDNSSLSIVIWFKGGGTTYQYNCNYIITPVVYDGTANPVPLQISGTSGNHIYNTKSSVDPYVNSIGTSSNTTVYYTSSGNNYFAGNVGIGTLNPQSALAVNGQISAKSVQVSLNGWSDDVFEKEYKLLPLKKLESFITLHKHLPEIPDQAEVAKQGIDIGEMNRLLLKKVEELSLYLIEKDKEMQEQKAVNKELQVQIDLLKAKVH